MSNSQKSYRHGVCWLRRDLRLNDHHALSEALSHCQNVSLLFIFDKNILDALKKQVRSYCPNSFSDDGRMNDRRIVFILEALKDIQNRLEELGSTLFIRYGDPKKIVPKLMEERNTGALFFNRDYEPYAIERDGSIERALKKHKLDVFTFKDHVIYEKDEVLKDNGEVYRVFTPYKNKWLERYEREFNLEKLRYFDCRALPNVVKQYSQKERFQEHLAPATYIEELGFKHEDPEASATEKSGKNRLHYFSSQKLSHYHETRDYPSKHGTSELSPFLRHGLVSIRQMVNASLSSKDEGHKTWLSELVWRDFYQMILAEFPHVNSQAFKQSYENINWRGKKPHFQKWAQGETGFPLVDESMRCLNQTGLMPNRLRMLTASFLCKTLLLNWKWGERYFALKLLDYDLAANNGGWQWSASTGCDAQPYFRIFNPYTQSQKFDPEGTFIRKFCPELSNFSNKLIHTPHETTPLEQEAAKCRIGKDYPAPIVDYKANRDVALKMYKSSSDPAR